MLFVCSFSIISFIVSLWTSISNDLLGNWYGFILLIIFFAVGFIVCLFLFLVIAYICTLKVDIEKEIDAPYKVYSKFCTQFAQMLCILSGVKTIVNGIEKIPSDTRFMLVSNHRSNLDPIVAMDKLRNYDLIFVSKIANMHIPVIGKFIHMAGYLAIDRENARNAVKTINKAAEYIKNDAGSIAIYPEGTRTKGEKMIDFHPGSFKIAKKTNVPIVVTSIRGTEKCKYMFFNRSEVIIDIIDVISAEEVKASKTVELSEKARSMIFNNLKSYGDKVEG